MNSWCGDLNAVEQLFGSVSYIFHFVFVVAIFPHLALWWHQMHLCHAPTTTVCPQTNHFNGTYAPTDTSVKYFVICLVAIIIKFANNTWRHNDATTQRRCAHKIRNKMMNRLNGMNANRHSYALWILSILFYAHKRHSSSTLDNSMHFNPTKMSNNN